jgi:O-antigen ligase
LKPAVTSNPFAKAILLALLVGLLLTACLIDASADAGFDAPKRAALLTVAALVGLFGLCHWFVSKPPLACHRPHTPAGWGIVVCGLILLASLLTSTTLARQPEVANHYLKQIFLLLCIPLTLAFIAVNPNKLLLVALAACVFNATLSLLQLAGIQLPIEVEHIGGRFASGSLLGNEGYVAMAACFGALISFHLFTLLKTKLTQALLLTGGLICLAAILLNRQVTSGIALVGTLLLWQLCMTKRWAVLRNLAVLASLALLCLLTPSLRSLTFGAVPLATYEKVSTYRVGAWVAAVEMITDRPWLGHGLGSYANDGLRHRLNAEIRLKTRLEQPLGSTFTQAHQEALQLAAEVGLPAILAVITALGLTLTQLMRLKLNPSTPPAEQLEAGLLFTALTAGCIMSLAWFPWQIPFTSLLLLITLGRALFLIRLHPC